MWETDEKTPRIKRGVLKNVAVVLKDEGELKRNFVVAEIVCWEVVVASAAASAAAAAA
ncbi:MAG: hypothetical protein ACI9KE_005238, partial [Polyangiales bacterium]